jgi:hypothetical protein
VYIRDVRAIAVTLLVLATLSCGGEGPSSKCPLSHQGCAGDAGCAGEQLCDPATGEWGACLCRGGGPDGGTDADAGGGPRLGGECAADDECPAGAFCLRGDSHALFGGAPPTGTCVGTCDAQTGCARFGAGAVCVQTDAPTGGDGGVSSSGLCFEGCTVGKAGGTGTTKCHGREHNACAPVEGGAAGAGYCRPLCTTSGDCLTGVCDPKRSVCVASAPLEQGFGLVCAAPPDGGAGDGGADAGDAGADDGGADAPADAAEGGAAPPACGGLCVGLGASSEVCTRRCRFGSTGECATQMTAGHRRGGCLFVTKGGGLGDLGYCGELCDCNRDCGEGSFVCDAFEDAALETAFGRKGVCTPTALVVGHPLPCAN